MSEDMARFDQQAGAPAGVESLLSRTTARLFRGRTGSSYRTATQLELRVDHAAARDAVEAAVDLERDFGGEFVRHWRVLPLSTRAQTKAEYLRRPDLGRSFDETSVATLVGEVPKDADVQVAIGDGLSAAAVVAQVPGLLPLLAEETERRGWTFGRPLFIHHCRVGVLNEIGERLRPTVAILLIGERPGLATAESLSAYLAFQPRAGDTDARRNLVSNIHVAGVPISQAARRILALADRLVATRKSGVDVKEGVAELEDR